MQEIDDSLELALERVSAFRAIHEGSSRGVTKDALLCLHESVGIGERSRELLGEHLAERCEPGQGGHVFLGVLIGLLAAHYEQDKRDRPAPPARGSAPAKEPSR